MTASDSAAALEALPLGEPFADALAIAESDAKSAHAAALALLFPSELAPMTADAIAEYTWRTSRLGAAGYGERLAELHHAALASHPELARMLRSRDAIADVEEAAARTALPTHHTETHATAAARAASGARTRYQAVIAGQVADVASDHPLAPAARQLLAADALLARVAAERTRRENHARAELERVQAEQRDAARQTSHAVIERVREAERIAADARARAVETTEQARHARADGLIERLRAHKLRELRVGRDDGERYAVDDLVKGAHGMSIEQLARYEAALAAMERA